MAKKKKVPTKKSPSQKKKTPPKNKAATPKKAATKAKGVTPEPHSKVKKRPTQSRLPGHEQERDKRLEELAKKYEHARDQRMAYLKEETDFKNRMLERMRADGIKLYRSHDADVECELVPSEETIKVRKPEADAADVLVPADKPAKK